MVDEQAVVVENCKVVYSDFLLNIPYLEVPRGFVTGLIGRNGAGKTTLIKAILELVDRDRGSIKILDCTMKNHEMEIKNNIGYVNDEFPYPNYFTAQLLAKRIGLFYKDFDMNFYKNKCEDLGVKPTLIFGDYSKGTKAKVALIFALAHHPRLLILDEPTANLDPVSRNEIVDLLYEYMQEEDHTILYSTHNTNDLDKIADFVTMIEKGKVLFTVSKDKLQEDCQYFECQGELPEKMKQCVYHLEKTNQGYIGMCVRAQQFRNDPNLRFTPMTIEEIMVHYEK